MDQEVPIVTSGFYIAVYSIQMIYIGYFSHVSAFSFPLAENGLGKEFLYDINTGGKCIWVEIMLTYIGVRPQRITIDYRFFCYKIHQ